MIYEVSRIKDPHMKVSMPRKNSRRYRISSALTPAKFDDIGLFDLFIAFDQSFNLASDFSVYHIEHEFSISLDLFVLEIMANRMSNI